MANETTGAFAFCYAFALMLMCGLAFIVCRDWADSELAFVLGGLTVSALGGCPLLYRDWTAEKWRPGSLTLAATFVLFAVLLAAGVLFGLVLIALLLGGHGWTPFM